jgi:hypothetical protein
MKADHLFHRDGFESRAEEGFSELDSCLNIIHKVGSGVEAVQDYPDQLKCVSNDRRCSGSFRLGVDGWMKGATELKLTTTTTTVAMRRSF